MLKFIMKMRKTNPQHLMKYITSLERDANNYYYSLYEVKSVTENFYVA